MKTPRPLPSSARGSAFITTIIIVGVLTIVTASILRYSVGERRSNERQRLVLRARNMAENVALYASEQITTKLYRMRGLSPRAFMTGTNAIHLPPDDVLATRFSKPADVEVRAGLTSSTGLAYIDPQEFPNDPNAGLQVSISQVPIIAKSTMTHPTVGQVTAHAEQSLQVAMIPLFQFAIFYNMDLEFGPGPRMTINGPVHTNGDFIARIQSGFNNAIRFTERVTTAKGFFANTGHRGSTYMANGAEDAGPGGNGPLYFRKPSEAITGGTEIKASNGIWRDHKWGGSTETTTSLNQFRSFALSTYGGNLRTSVHGVTPLVLPGVGEYSEETAETRKNGRQIIEAPASTDAGALLGTKFARNAGLYIIVNPDDETRTGRMPNGTAVTMRARSYRAWLNEVNSDGSHRISEVVLPGQPSYGQLNSTANTLPNAYRADTSVGHNQVLRIPQGGGTDPADTGYAVGGALPTFDATPDPSELLTQDAYFYDMRRAFNNTGYPFSRSSSNWFRPRPIAKIDFDLTRFKMAVDRTLFDRTASTIYHPGTPNNSNWSSNIFNSAAVPANHGLGLALGTNVDFRVFPAANPITLIQRSPAGNYIPGQLTIGGLQQTGASGSAAPYSARFVIEKTTAVDPYTVSDGTWSANVEYTSASDESVVTYTPPAGITAIRVSQYSGGASPSAARLLDRQIIPIVNASASTVTAHLTNDRYVVPANNLSSGFIFPEAVTEMRVFVGGIDDTANWTFTTSAATNISGRLGGNSTNTSSAQTGYGSFAHRYTAATMSASTGSVTITAAKAGYAAIERTFTLVSQKSITGAPGTNQTGVWLTTTNGPGPDPFRLYYAPSTPGDPPVAVPLSGLVVGNSSPWYDGITVYIHSAEAENISTTGTGNSMTRQRVDSGVRLWNGRGPLISLPAASYPARTGFSLVTNDAVYIVGHYNADGTINANLNSTGVAGYSGRYPESSSEMLTAVMGDAITILSQPRFTRYGSASNNYSYHQSSGWADSLSASRRDDSASYSTSWFSTNPSNSNTLDGLNASIEPALLPSLTVPRSFNPRPGPRSTGTTAPPSEVSPRTAKFAPSETEISTCLLTGIVPTVRSTDSGSKQTSGGAHNFPRLSENWAGSVPLYIRGSLIAMFESRVATEPWGIRWYQGAVREWGLHESLRDVNHDVPLEPVVLNAQRRLYQEITHAEYAARKAEIEALPR
jgi:type II secretory pathway pseudopilin PulG